MDTSTMTLVGSLVVGLLGLAVFFMKQGPTPVKKRSDGSGMKPRGISPHRHCCLCRHAAVCTSHMRLFAQMTGIHNDSDTEKCDTRLPHAALHMPHAAHR